MWEAFQTDPRELAGFLVVASIAIAVVAGMWIKAWRKNEAEKRDAELKLEMISRGMSAGDIERVLAAKTVDNSPGDTTGGRKS